MSQHGCMNNFMTTTNTQQSSNCTTDHFNLTPTTAIHTYALIFPQTVLGVGFANVSMTRKKMYSLTSTGKSADDPVAKS